jgi:hypothetical protein
MGVTTNAPGVEGDDERSQVKGEFDQWRAQRRGKRERIPERLWERAVSLARRHGVSRVAALLHLEYAGLGRRLTRATGGQAPVQVKSNALEFVEMFAPARARAPVPAQTAAPLRAECVVDLVNARGLRMRVELSGSGVSGLSALCKTFWSAR